MIIYGVLNQQSTSPLLSLCISRSMSSLSLLNSNINVYIFFIIVYILSTPCLQPMLVCTLHRHTYSHTHTHVQQTLLRADNISCNLQTYCVERRSPVAFRVESTPAPSLSNIFLCFSATKSLLFPTNDQAILNVYTIHLGLNRYVCSALARSFFLSSTSVQRLAKN